MTKKPEVEAPTSYPLQLTIRPLPFPGNAAQRMIPRRSSGWDPYEVWRTRVKEAPRAPEDARLDKVG